MAAAASVLGVAGALDWRFDVLAHLAPVYLVIGLVCGAVAAFSSRPWRRAAIALSAVAVLAGLLLVAPELLRSTGPERPYEAARKIKIIQVNARRTNTNIGRIASWLASERPDIVTISESRPDLRDLLIRQGWSVAGGRGSLMIFTRERYLEMNRPQPPDLRVNFVNASYDLAGERVEIVTAHLDWPSRAVVADQVRSLEEVVRHLPRDRMILTGDLNATPWSAELRRLDRTLGLVRRDRAVASWPAQVGGSVWPFPVLPIDHVYAGPAWATVSVERGPWLGSDHYPLIVTLAPIVRR